MNTSSSTFGNLLRSWRKSAGLSQLDLALLANTTQRHLSFMETGRSRPGHDIVLRLAEALGVGLRDQNTLVRAAGFPATFPEFDLEDQALEPALHVVRSVLDKHNPYPAWAVAAGLRFAGSNAAAERLMPGLTALSPAELVRQWCVPQPGEEEAVALRRALLALRREMKTAPHPSLEALLADVETKARKSGAGVQAATRLEEASLSQVFHFKNERVKTFATILRFEHATDITLSELRVELVFPADAHAEACFKQWAQTD